MDSQVKKIYDKLVDLHEGLIDGLEHEKLSESDMREINLLEMQLLSLMDFIENIDEY